MREGEKIKYVLSLGERSQACVRELIEASLRGEKCHLTIFNLSFLICKHEDKKIHDLRPFTIAKFILVLMI